jgi:hypothetical protein
MLKRVCRRAGKLLYLLTVVMSFYGKRVISEALMSMVLLNNRCYFVISLTRLRDDSISSPITPTKGYQRTSSTRRFLARPASASLDATGA